MTATTHIGMSALFIICISVPSNGEAQLGNANADTHSSLETGRAVTDIDGNVYTTVAIGSQVWLVENLATTRYRDGTRIPHVEDNESWATMETGAYCSPAVESSFETQAYGLLYKFRAVSDCHGLCPEGWHVPSAAEWNELIDFLGGVDVAGRKMKSTDPRSWRIHVPGTTNESGFSALPAGGRGSTGRAGEVGYYATWWSSTLHDSLYSWHWGLHPDKHEIRANPGHVQSGFSVRCVEDRRCP